MGFWAAAAPAIVAGGISLAGALFNKPKGPPNPPDYDWIKNYGPGIWNYLSKQGRGLYENPYGLGASRTALERIGRDTASAGYGAASRNIDRNTAISGLSPAGGSASRQQYYAGQSFAEDLNRRLSEVEVADFQAKEEQRQRGLNLLFSLTNKSPVYSQIVAQNYWNNLQSQNQMWNNLGQSAGNIYDAYLQNKWLNTNPYGSAASSAQSSNPYTNLPGYTNEYPGGVGTGPY